MEYHFVTGVACWIAGNDESRLSYDSGNTYLREREPNQDCGD